MRVGFNIRYALCMDGCCYCLIIQSMHGSMPAAKSRALEACRKRAACGLLLKESIGKRAPLTFQSRDFALTHNWQSALDPDGDVVSYSVTIASDSSFSQVVHQQHELTGSAMVNGSW